MTSCEYSYHYLLFYERQCGLVHHALGGLHVVALYGSHVIRVLLRGDFPGVGLSFRNDLLNFIHESINIGNKSSPLLRY